MKAKTPKTDDWTGRAQDALLELLEELVSRRDRLSPIELIGATRALTEAITASRTLLPKKTEEG